MFDDRLFIEWGKPLDPLTATLVRLAMVQRNGPPEIAAHIDLGSCNYSDQQIHAFAANLIQRAGEYAGTIVGVQMVERILAGDDPNTDFWLRVVQATAKIDQAEPEAGDPLH